MKDVSTTVCRVVPWRQQEEHAGWMRSLELMGATTLAARNRLQAVGKLLATLEHMISIHGRVLGNHLARCDPERDRPSAVDDLRAGTRRSIAGASDVDREHGELRVRHRRVGRFHRNVVERLKDLAATLESSCLELIDSHSRHARLVPRAHVPSGWPAARPLLIGEPDLIPNPDRGTPTMKVHDIMTRDVATCAPMSPLNEATRLMWERDCGFVPVTEPGGQRLRGVLTDRDICMAAYTKNRPLTELRAESIMCCDPETCRPDDDVSVASDLMRTHQVRRLPVTDQDGNLVGVLSLNDLAVAASDTNSKTMRQDVAMTLAGVCTHRAVVAPV